MKGPCANMTTFRLHVKMEAQGEEYNALGVPTITHFGMFFKADTAVWYTNETGCREAISL